MNDKLSFTTLATPDRTLEDIVGLAHAHGIAGVDIRCSDHKGEVDTGADDGTLRRVADAIRAAGLALPSVFCYPALPRDVDRPWDVYAAEVRESMRIGAALGAEAVRIFTPKLREGMEPEDVLARCADIFRRELDNALPGAPLMLIQNHRGHFDARQSLRLAEAVGNDRFGLAFSPDHVVLSGANDWDALLDAVLPWSRQLYVSDWSTADGATALPGEGDAPLRDIVRRFAAAGFAGWYTFKYERMWNPRLAAPEISLPAFMRFMSGCA